MIFELNEIDRAAKAVLDRMQSTNCCLVLFEGEMGSGKTTLISAMARLMGIGDAVSSPTYAIANEYAGEDWTLSHLDLYRLESTEEALDAGTAEYLDRKEPVFIEWPDLLTPLLPEHYIRVEIRSTGEKQREIRIFAI